MEGCGMFFAEECKGALKGARNERRCARIGQRRESCRESSDASGEGERREYRYEKRSDGLEALARWRAGGGKFRGEVAVPEYNMGSVFTTYLCQLSFY